jgi:hypothetical protein
VHCPRLLQIDIGDSQRITFPSEALDCHDKGRIGIPQCGCQLVATDVQFIQLILLGRQLSSEGGYLRLNTGDLTTDRIGTDNQRTDLPLQQRYIRVDTHN